MSKVVDLKQYRTRQKALKSYGAWEKRFRETYAESTGLPDLSHRVITYLATPGENSNTAFYELIMGTLAYGEASGFYHLGNEEQLRVVDIHLFLADHVRFEMMRRLGWLGTLVSGDYALIELIMRFERLKLTFRNHPPELNSSHPGYGEFMKLSVREREVSIRQMLPKALEAFGDRDE